MEKTVRIALTGFLIVLAYAIINFIDTRSFILPFPFQLYSFWCSARNGVAE